MKLKHHSKCFTIQSISDDEGVSLWSTLTCFNIRSRSEISVTRGECGWDWLVFFFGATLFLYGVARWKFYSRHWLYNLYSPLRTRIGHCHIPRDDILLPLFPDNDAKRCSARVYPLITEEYRLAHLEIFWFDLGWLWV